jgi:LmbE family N-acetylglucosaminyl deacetylase
VKVLVIVAHPDDEVLGCGGTIARHASDGDRIEVLILAEGATSRDGQRDPKVRSAELAALRLAARDAAKVLGTEEPIFGDLPDNRLDSMPLIDVVKLVERMVIKVRPDIVYTHHAGDLNVDHRIVHEAVMTACRPQPDSSVQQILFFETVSSTEWRLSTNSPFMPSWFVDVAAWMPTKLRALEVYDAEMRRWPHARSTEAIEALARWRGATVGCVAAEAFVLGRGIRRATTNIDSIQNERKKI